MSELIHNLGIEWGVLVAQIINFAILFYVLKRFALGPIMKILDAREVKLKAQQNAEVEFESRRSEIQKEKVEILNAARKESERIIRSAEVSAIELKKEAERIGEGEAAKIIQAGRKMIDDERKQAEAGFKSEIGTLIAFSVEKAVGTALDKRAHAALVDEAKSIMSSYAKDHS